ncbi:MAG: carbamoyltransferase HypF, partial [Gammaproteobacteria bacterium]
MNPAATGFVPTGNAAIVARQIVISGRVQGVGYRPFVYRIAHELGISGLVRNGGGKVFILAEGEAGALEKLQAALIDRAPPLARPVIQSLDYAELSGLRSFAIEPSELSTTTDIHIPPDYFTCDECLQEMSSDHERRYRYPFINCTQCGPRYTLIESMPYDRPNTSMRDFQLCDACRSEYENPLDRRFHAQPLACPDCGPTLEFVSAELQTTDTEAAIQATIAAIRRGAIIAIKGVGGYHLVCDACNDAAVRDLRQRKQRPHKPLAVLFPFAGKDGLAVIRKYVAPTSAEAHRIVDPSRPIVLVRKRSDCSLSDELAPGLDELGVFLSYSPLHHILLQDFNGPVVATSGNLSGEPVITDNSEATIRLADIADVFLHHNRPIIRPADDAVVRVIGGSGQLIRPGRGSAPAEFLLPRAVEVPTIALGGHMKNTIALAWDRRVVVSPHVGDLDSPRSMQVFEQLIADMQDLYGVSAERIIHDLHPGYASTRWAQQQLLPCIAVQHHRAHASALYGEHAATGSWLVFAWDGSGYGDDETLWGGEGFIGQPGDWQRTASFRPFQLVGGDKAGREPWRSAAALAWEVGENWMPPVDGAALAATAWRKSINTFKSSAAGRLFDAAAVFVMERQIASFEGQGPMELESIAAGA